MHSLVMSDIGWMYSTSHHVARRSHVCILVGVALGLVAALVARVVPRDLQPCVVFQHVAVDLL